MSDQYSQDKQNSIEGWYFSSAELTSALATGRMINPSIDLSNPCNLNCSYCFIEEKNSPRKIRKPKELTHEETVDVVKQLHSCGARTINLVGAGEPTIDPHFEETVELIDGLGITTVLFTNGIRFISDPGLLRLVRRKKVSVVLKYNSTSADVQDLVAGRKGYTEKRNRALELLIDNGFNAHAPTRVGLDTMVFQGNLPDIPKIHRMCRETNIFPIAGEYIPTGRTENGHFQGQNSLIGFTETERNRIAELLEPINPDQRRKLLQELTAIDIEFGIERRTSYAYYGGGICTQLLGLYIDIEGNIWPCVARRRLINGQADQAPLGNVRNNASVTDIWRTHSYMRLIRQSFSGGCPYKAPLGNTPRPPCV